ncbi:ThiF family adenylyltransferase [Actinoplanes solisilvae]|uniref:ThiF family adenylyltransferase n=1 Tax=Actinoplanes solisilvae TaxID=2486853 RepID=UPI000FD98626|nr:ThiF family adenylyltransferase [Actinoplanes solisilvae]
MITDGHDEALRQLRELAQATAVVDEPAGIQILEVRLPFHPRDWLRIDLLLDCRFRDTWRPMVPLLDAEQVTVLVPSDYPFQKPMLTVDHRRFATLPHVCWGELICLYLTDGDWDPSRGMRGFAERMLDWFRQVADGTLPDAEIVLEPPLTRNSSLSARLIVRSDVPEPLALDQGLWTGFAVVEAVRFNTYEVRRWLPENDPFPSEESEEEPARDRSFLAVVLALPNRVAATYPESAEELLDLLARQGVTAERVNGLLEKAAQWTSASALPMTLVITPAPRHLSPSSRTAYLAAWSLPPRRLRPADSIAWVKIYDQRPQFTRRRDRNRPAAWLRGKRVLVLGCGGLGAPIAEHCVRAGVSALHLVDSKVVTPGILVRQPYWDRDIGNAKANVLAARLAEINSDTAITPLQQDAIDLILGAEGLPVVDLIVDATASRSVATALERARWTTDGPQPPLLSVMVGHDCSLGASTLALPGASGAGDDILRRLSIAAAEDGELADVLDDFHPDLPRTDLFVPEPGCSDPTYVGSAADLALFGAGLLNDALRLLGGERHPASPKRWATVLRSPGRAPATTRRHWPEPLIMQDMKREFQIRLDQRAYADVRREMLRTADERGLRVETGGLLLGQIDIASRVVWVTEAQGLPAGSTARVEGLRLDPAEARASVAERRFRTRNLVGFIGEWHSHPRSSPQPSRIDIESMTDLARSTGTPVLLMIFGGDGPDGLPSRFAELFLAS